jgi:hypothetical protein
MKKTILYGLGFTFLALGTVSCGKSTTGKITNNWTIVSQIDEQTVVNSGGDKHYSKNTYTETTFSNYSEQTPLSGNTIITETSGNVTVNTIEIKKDGTWTWNQELTYNEDLGGGNTSNYVVKNVHSGKWNFVKKSEGEDFKKNERISLEALERTSSSVQTVNNVLANSNSSKTTYLPGESIVVYTIVKSKNKELELKLDVDSQDVMNGNTSTKKMTRSIILEEK